MRTYLTTSVLDERVWKCLCVRLCARARVLCVSEAVMSECVWVGRRGGVCVRVRACVRVLVDVRVCVCARLIFEGA